VIFLVGLHAVGKTEAGKEFAGADFAVVDTGPLMRRYHAEHSGGLGFGDWVGQGEALHGPEYTNAVCVSAAKCHLALAAESGRETVVIGFRSLEGIRYFQHNAAEPWERAVVVYIDPPSETRLRRRWLARERDGITLAAFRRLLQAERESGLEQIRDFAHHVIPNCGRALPFLAEIRSLVGLLQASPRQDFGLIPEPVLAVAS
jgi:dephospho-CoA kinase